MRKKRKIEVIDGGIGTDRKEELLIIKPVKHGDPIDGGEAHEENSVVTLKKITVEGLLRALRIFLVFLVILSILSIGYDIIILFRPLPQQAISIYPTHFESRELFSIIRDLFLITVIVLTGKKTLFF